MSHSQKLHRSQETKETQLKQHTKDNPIMPRMRCLLHFATCPCQSNSTLVVAKHSYVLLPRPSCFPMQFAICHSGLGKHAAHTTMHAWSKTSVKTPCLNAYRSHSRQKSCQIELDVLPTNASPDGMHQAELHEIYQSVSVGFRESLRRN